MVSNMRSPPQITLSSRQKFGDPYGKAMSKETANEPGPGQYKLDGKNFKDETPPKYSFTKCPPPSIKSEYAPGTFHEYSYFIFINRCFK